MARGASIHATRLFHRIMKKLLALSSICAAVLTCSLAHAQTTDPVVLSFSTVGDSRQDPASPDTTQLPLSQQDYQWLQNSTAWSRIMREISAKKSNLLFFNGDMIMGYGNAGLPSNVSSVSAIVNSDLVRHYTEFAFWRGMVAPLIANGTYVLPVAGNHETQCRSGTVTSPAGITASITANTVWDTVTCQNINGANATGKIAMAVNEAAFRANMADLVIDQTRMNADLPAGTTVSNISTTTPGSADGLTTDQTALSYSFDVGTSHFVIINTDPAGNDGTAPVNWLSTDFSAAQARGAQHYFVFGHKPAYSYIYNTSASAGGLDANPNGTANRDAFWKLIEGYGATYFCGHEHTVHVAQPSVSNGDGTYHTSTSYQVLVGSGGSPFDPKLPLAAGESATDRYYAYANVLVFQSGKVMINVYGFNAQYGGTQLIQSLSLAH